MLKVAGAGARGAIFRVTDRDSLGNSTSAIAGPSVDGHTWPWGRWEDLAGPVMRMGKPWDCPKSHIFVRQIPS